MDFVVKRIAVNNNFEINPLYKYALSSALLKCLIYIIINCNIAFAQQSTSKQTSPIKIITSIASINFFIQEIAKDNAIATNIIPKNKDAESYEPSFNIMNLITKSDMFIGIGMPFEKIWLPKIQSANTNLKILLIQEKLGKDSMHIWASLENAKEIAKIIAESLYELDYENEKFYKQNLGLLLKKIESTQISILDTIKQMPHKQFIVYHPILDSFADEYGLDELSLQQHGKKYGISDMLNLIKKGKKLQIKRVFSEHNNKDIQTLAREINARVVIINPIHEDYLNNMESIFTEIAKSYEKLDEQFKITLY